MCSSDSLESDGMVFSRFALEHYVRIKSLELLSCADVVIDSSSLLDSITALIVSIAEFTIMGEDACVASDFDNLL